MAALVERSYNGWRAHRDRHQIGVEQITVAGASFPNGVVRGDVQTVLGYVAEQFHRRVEPLVPGWCWGYNYRTNRNANNLSCHASGTAIDLNAPRHPNGRKGTFTAAQVREIRAILRECSGVVRWGGDFRGTPDEMHFEINALPGRVAEAARSLRASPLNPARPASPSAPITPPVQEDDDMPFIISAPGRGQGLIAGHGYSHIPTPEFVQVISAKTPGIKTVSCNDREYDILAASFSARDPKALSGIQAAVATLLDRPAAEVDAAAVAAAIPASIAADVADELAKRLKS